MLDATSSILIQTDICYGYKSSLSDFKNILTFNFRTVSVLNFFATFFGRIST